MVVARLQQLQHRHAAPSCPKDDQLGLVLLRPHAFRIVVIDEVVDYGEILGSTSPRVESIFGDGDVEGLGVVGVGGVVVDKESHDQSARDDDEEAERDEASVGIV